MNYWRGTVKRVLNKLEQMDAQERLKNAVPNLLVLDEKRKELDRLIAVGAALDKLKENVKEAEPYHHHAGYAIRIRITLDQLTQFMISGIRVKQEFIEREIQKLSGEINAMLVPPAQPAARPPSHPCDDGCISEEGPCREVCLKFGYGARPAKENSAHVCSDGCIREGRTPCMDTCSGFVFSTNSAHGYTEGAES